MKKVIVSSTSFLFIYFPLNFYVRDVDDASSDSNPSSAAGGAKSAGVRFEPPLMEMSPQTFPFF